MTKIPTKEAAPASTTAQAQNTAGWHADPRASISSSARIGAGVHIGPWAVVGDEVDLGEGCQLLPHAVVLGPARIGRDNTFYSFCSVGAVPQDLKFAGERSELVIGDGNQFRECVTISRGTHHGGGATRIGDSNLFMAYSHVGHDCQIGSHIIFVNGATLAGHVTVEDYANVGAFSPVHQFCRIGRYAYIAASTVITQDVPPFGMVVTERETHCVGANKVGLQRRGFSAERMHAIEQAFRLLLRSKLNTSQALEQMRETLPGSEDVKELIAFIEAAERGLVK
ncbi:MAG TPA: acyl-ACP--UDP-N-acetylglucosamine O-acyltransferase [Candidatus Acidoferrales bacterium]|nr:acyl-ACP--UDP-N-acetylglucosamine O-acyltransferase [Candidatus Acidoferrales bacterium]